MGCEGEKEYVFLAGLPRAGNTLLGSLVNQNPNVCLTAHSILMDVLWRLELIKRDRHFKNFPDNKSFENITKNIFKNYYSDYTANKIIDRGSWGMPHYLNQIKQNVVENPKFIILYRPVLECLASFAKIGYDGDEWCDVYMQDDGLIGQALCSIKNILDNDEKHIFINYSTLVSKPVQTIKIISDFIEEDYIPIKTENFKQFEANNISYDDSLFHSKELHTIRTDAIINEKTIIDDYLSKRTIDKYKNYDLVL